MADEGAVALGIASRLIIHLTGKGVIQKDLTIRLLADVEETFLSVGALEEAGLVRSLAEAIDHSIPDGPGQA